MLLETNSYSLATPKSKKTHAASTDTNIMAKVRVVVRVRPFLSHEITAKNGNPVSCISTLDTDCFSSQEVSVFIKDPESCRKECYQVDSLFGEDDNNVRRIFESEVRPLIPGVFNGINATVFAYGATGSGKTYTMQGNDGFPGLMPLAMSTILAMCQETGSTVEISYYEVYLDRCFDLLELKEKEIRILDDKDGKIHLRGLCQAMVNSMFEFEEVFSSAVQRRKIAHTGLNDVSSRSHGVLVIRVSTPGGNGSGAVVTGKLNLIDLAGNEDNRRTCNYGIRLQESAKINQSLFALSNVIYALNNNTRVPYRESKLTRILQDSLGGTSQALMVACLNPGEYQEAVHTVSLAARSRQITNLICSTPKTGTEKNKVDMEEKLRAWLESKGKTKSLQRLQGFGSKSVQKSNPPSSSRAKINNNNVIFATKERLPVWKLFENADVHDSFFEDFHPAVGNTREDTCPKGVEVTSEPVTNPASLSQHRATADIIRAKVPNDSFFEDLYSAVQSNREDICPKNDEIRSEPITNPATEPLEKEENVALGEPNQSMHASALTVNAKELLHTPLRKVLSPINQNLNLNNTLQNEETPYTGKKCTFLSEHKTPEPFSNTSKDKSITINTPLNKFNAMSSNLKSYLAQEYIDFLNTASKEELLSVKGIGQKMSEYIIELRETSPLKSLSDLEKIGLSSKQVRNLFHRAAGEVGFR